MRDVDRAPAVGAGEPGELGRGLDGLAEPFDSLVVFPDALTLCAIFLHFYAFAVTIVGEPLPYMLDPVRELLGAMPFVFAFDPLAGIHPAVDVDHCPVAFLVTVHPLAVVLVAAGIDLEPVAILFAGDEESFIAVTIRIAFFSVTGLKVVQVLSFELCLL